MKSATRTAASSVTWPSRSHCSVRCTRRIRRLRASSRSASTRAWVLHTILEDAADDVVLAAADGTEGIDGQGQDGAPRGGEGDGEPVKRQPGRTLAHVKTERDSHGPAHNNSTNAPALRPLGAADVGVLRTLRPEAIAARWPTLRIVASEGRRHRAIGADVDVRARARRSPPVPRALYPHGALARGGHGTTEDAPQAPFQWNPTLLHILESTGRHREAGVRQPVLSAELGTAAKDIFHPLKLLEQARLMCANPPSSLPSSCLRLLP